MAAIPPGESALVKDALFWIPATVGVSASAGTARAANNDKHTKVFMQGTSRAV